MDIFPERMSKITLPMRMFGEDSRSPEGFGVVRRAKSAFQQHKGTSMAWQDEVSTNSSFARLWLPISHWL